MLEFTQNGELCPQMSRQLNLISFNVPYPPDYGGVIDVYYKLKALKAAGVVVHLHTFYHSRPPAQALEEVASEVFYYPQKSAFESLSLKWPVMAKSRRSRALLQNLCQNDHPVLFDGFQTCYYLNAPALKDRKKLVRLHNIEWQYYSDMQKAARNIPKKLRYGWEAGRLKSAEALLRHADLLLPISRKDTGYYAGKLERVEHLPPFHGNDEVSSKPGKGDFVLYHGNLSVAENVKAVAFILRTIAPHVKVPVIIAGRLPTAQISQLCDNQDNVTLVADPNTGTLRQLMEDAHIHLLHTFQATGIKLKLINALFQGRFCVGNNEMLAGTGLESICETANTSREYIQSISRLMETPFSSDAVEQRRYILAHQFDNHANAAKLARWIFD